MSIERLMLVVSILFPIVNITAHPINENKCTASDSISTHVLETSIGAPGHGIDVHLFKLLPGVNWVFISTRVTDANGRVSQFFDCSSEINEGTYKMTFNVKYYYDAMNTITFFPYIDVIFDVPTGTSHCHVPILISPFGFTTYRGTSEGNQKLVEHDNTQEKELITSPETFDLTNRPIFREYLNTQLKKYNVNGVSGSFIFPAKVVVGNSKNRTNEPFIVLPFVSGKSNVAKNADMEPSTWVQFASISKTVGTAYAMEVFQIYNIAVGTSVNSVLEKYGSSFRLESIDKSNFRGDDVTFEMLLRHTAGLKMHYVNGISMKEEFPPVLDLLTGKYADSHGYQNVYVHEKPGVHFSYSGASFLVLQHVLEIIQDKNIHESLQLFFKDDEVSFQQAVIPGVQYAVGYLDDGKTPVRDGGHLSFPPLAAGGMGTTRSLARLLGEVAFAYQNTEGSERISHETSNLMLDNGVDKGAVEFMASLIGYGVFIARAGKNRFILHQAANDGFRGIAMVCFDGPAASEGPIGFVMVCNGNNNGTILLAEVSKFILRNQVFGMKDDVDWSRVENKDFNQDDVRQEEIVNKGFKDLVLDAFLS